MSETTKPVRGRPSPKMFISLGLGVVIAVALIAIVSVVTGGKVTNSSNQGKRIATFSASGLDGGTQRSPWSSGHPSVLVFFASWCEPCHKEIPRLAKYVSSHSQGRVQVLGIDTGDQRAAAQAFTKKDHVTFNVAFDPNYKISAGLFKLAALPDTVFLNAKGVVQNVHIGPISTAQFSSEIRSLEH